MKNSKHKMYLWATLLLLFGLLILYVYSVNKAEAKYIFIDDDSSIKLTPEERGYFDESQLADLYRPVCKVMESIAELRSSIDDRDGQIGALDKKIRFIEVLGRKHSSISSMQGYIAPSLFMSLAISSSIMLEAIAKAYKFDAQ